MTPTATLTDRDRDIIARARELAALDGDGGRARSPASDSGTAYGRAFGSAQWFLGELADILDRLGGQHS